MDPVQLFDKVMQAATRLAQETSGLEYDCARLAREVASLPGGLGSRVPLPSSEDLSQIAWFGPQAPQVIPKYSPACFVPMTLKQIADEWRAVADGPAHGITDAVSVFDMAKGNRGWESPGAGAYGEMVLRDQAIAEALEGLMLSAVRAWTPPTRRSLAGSSPFWHKSLNGPRPSWVSHSPSDR